MKFISILTSLLLILILSCDKEPAGNSNSETTGGTTGGGELEIDYSICENCIWLQNDCNGDWFIGYNILQSFSGFQFDIEGLTLTSASGGSAELNGFSISSNQSTILVFSLSGATISAGSGKLLEISFSGNPIKIDNIIFPDDNAQELDISYYGIINCYYNSILENTGEFQLTIFSDSISSLSPGDEIGIFDLGAIKNYNDCSNQIGELLVGAGVWNGSQLNLVSIGSVDLCAFNGPQLAGFVDGNDIVVKIWKANDNIEYNTELVFEGELNTFNSNSALRIINDINLINPLSKRSF